jgi:uncharacterized membrane protein required for colicin V production
MMKALLPALFFGTLGLSAGMVAGVVVTAVLLLLLNDKFNVADESDWD